MVRVKNKIELVSLHIPKTAGTSFRNTLKTVYGDDAVRRVDITRKFLKVEEKAFFEKRLSPRVKVIHGHFRYTDVFAKFELAKSVPVITWLRNPVDRVISNYYYLKKIILDRIIVNGTGGELENRMIRTLEEYATCDRSKNRISKFLRGSKLEDFFFIGIVENYKDDLARLAGLLNWDRYPVLEQNRSSETKPEVSEETRKYIESINQKDMDIYKRALALNSSLV
jgi:hypothetical protein